MHRRVAAIYHIWPHYRRGVMRAMDRSESVIYHFLGSESDYQGIRTIAPDEVRNFKKTRLRWFGPILWQQDAVNLAVSRKYDVIIYLSDMHFASTWIGAGIARLLGKKVLFWGHGWLGPEKPVKAMVRNIFYRLANRVMVYNERAKELGVRSGFPENQITVVYNSLDVAQADTLIEKMKTTASNGRMLNNIFDDLGRPLLICTARITALCRFDVLLRAASVLSARGTPVNVLFVGDGPERANLAMLAEELGVSAHFYGACYDESITGSLLYHADLTVSPGKIGLTAMHSLMYGTAAITHGNLSEQMPEVEAVVPGETGDFFRQGDSNDLADVIERWLSAGRSRHEVRSACRAVIREKWHPDVQARIIEQTVMDVLAHE